ncbi:MAG: hypothetical protein R3335_04810 [Anaerolineales bacterium]|nr:hypothetical protein [Anaerolineales bacterium]
MKAILLSSDNPRRIYFFAVPALLAIGAMMSSLDGAGNFLRGWLVYSLLLGLAALLIAGALRVAAADRAARSATLAAFLARLILGIALTAVLPVYGYPDQNVHENGYWFFDAYNRDTAAWQLAKSDAPILSAFTGDHVEDQYGGMLAMSAGIYRLLSPDAHRAMLILILTAVAGALGVPFLWAASRSWFGGSVGATAAWIFALYPEAVILGGSQMREAFIMSGIALAFYGLTRLKDGRWASSAWLIAALIILFFFSPPAAVLAIGVLSGLWLIERQFRISWTQVGVIAGLTIAGVLLVIGIFSQYPSLQQLEPWQVLVEWFQNNMAYQIYIAERSSGRIQLLFDEVGEQFSSLVILAYGIAQPVLPANIVVPGNPVVRVLGTLRAAGWYAVAPLLIYGFITLLRPIEEKRRRQLLWINLWIGGAVVVAALVAGGDAWDNPRYRTWMIAWVALAASWALWWARSHRDAWLSRTVLVEAVFVLIFLQWYISRYTGIFVKLFFWQMVALILAVGALILAVGYVRDRMARSRDSGDDSSLDG